MLSLSKLLVREKAESSRDYAGRGFYLINQNRSSPDMYEFECRSVEHRRHCMDCIQAAAAAAAHCLTPLLHGLYTHTVTHSF